MLPKAFFKHNLLWQLIIQLHDKKMKEFKKVCVHTILYIVSIIGSGNVVQADSCPALIDQTSSQKREPVIKILITFERSCYLCR